MRPLTAHEWNHSIRLRKRRAAAARRFRFWLARQLRIAHRRVVDERCDNDRRLLEIGCLNMIVYIEMRVMRPRAVLDRILDELESREANRIERQVVGAAGIADR